MENSSNFNSAHLIVPASDIQGIKTCMELIIARCDQFGLDNIIRGLAIEAIQHITARSKPCPEASAGEGGGKGLDLDAIERRRKATTDCPWVKCCHSERGGDWWTIHRGVEIDGVITALPGRQLFRVMSSGLQGGNDAAFVAHAREDIDALIAEVKRLRARPVGSLDALREAVAEYLYNMDSQGAKWIYENDFEKKRWRAEADALLAHIGPLLERSSVSAPREPQPESQSKTKGIL
jgi:hypothetical protein